MRIKRSRLRSGLAVGSVLLSGVFCGLSETSEAATAYYLNDASTNGTVYTTAPGNDANDGLTPATPKTSIQATLDTYDTVGGDVIYVDTGLYNVSGDTRIIWSRGGDAEHGPLTIQGSTNVMDGGSTLHRTGSGGSGQGFNVNASHVTLRDMAVRNFNRGIYLNTNRNVTAEHIWAYSNNVGIFAFQTDGATLRNLRISDNEAGVDLSNARTTIVENVTFVSNADYSYRARNTILNNTLQNNIFVVTHTNAPALAGPGVTSGQSFVDYNIYYFENQGTIHGGYSDLRLWQLGEGHDFRSAITDPLLHDPASGNFHLRSEFGRYRPDVGFFVPDGETSWAIGRGNPESPFDQQPAPTAGRINLGAFGNTEFASKGSTNPVVLTRTLMDGITISNLAQQVQPLVWAINNLPEGLLFDVEYSPDGGANWYTIQEDVDADREYVIWTTDPTLNAFNARWRVIGEADSVVYSAESDPPFDVEFGSFEGITDQFFTSGRHTIRWRGAWAERYRVEYTENGIHWTNAPTGPGEDQDADFISDRGGDFFYQDVESTNVRFRSYRVFWDPQ